jgi:putative salt-induced outer membrane protein YdiY
MFITSLIAFLPAATTAPLAAPALLQPLDSSIVSLVAQDEAMTDPQWTGSVSLSAISTTGNTETESFNFDSNAVLRREIDRFTWKAFLNYGTDSGSGASVLTQRKMGTSLQYDHFVNEAETTYVYGNSGVEYDALADLDMRLTIGAGMGYQFYEEDKFKLSGEAGLTSVTEDFEGAPSDDYLSLRLAGNLYKQFDDNLILTQGAEVLPSLQESADINASLDTKLNLSLSESMFTSFQWVLDYDNTPSGSKDRVDNRFILSLGWSF